MLTQMNPCAILTRERAILINLEHVKCIVTTQYVLVLNVENAKVLSFLDELQKKLRQQVDYHITQCLSSLKDTQGQEEARVQGLLEGHLGEIWA